MRDYDSIPAISFDRNGRRATRANAATLVFEYMARRLYDMYKITESGDGRHRA